MKNITVKQIEQACGGKYTGPDHIYESRIAGVVIDSRKVEKDYIFVAIVGENSDGHDFAAKAIESGALCCISEKYLEGVPHILVESSVKALQEAAKYYRSILDIKVVGITGSVGKTSTKEMIHAVLSQRYSVHKTQGNYNNGLGVPLTIFQIEDYHKVAILEMGISDFGEMHLLADIARPDICVVTNIGICHLENLKTRDGILKAKSEIFDFIDESAVIVLNKDDDKLVTLENIKDIEPMTFGIENKSADVVADTITTDGIAKTTCNIKYKGTNSRININIPGRHMVYNACAGYLLGKIFELSEEEITKGIETLVPVNGRNNIIRTEKYVVIDDCYNANPISMKASIDVISNATGRNVVILGDMFELGENEVSLHKEIGEYIAKKNVKQVICAGRLAKNIADGVKENSDISVNYFVTRDEMISVIDTLLEKGDNILVKASHGMGFDKVVEVLTK